ncbi:hypothetical protein [Streptosporangium sp. NBC_01756]|uniref:hypothetical protein n=1 Tax=Streptosporangium sp. NBC_01756 TaxID=2975950 RepID=UPI002DD95EBA|nr:hypothetical protein [Streptosporangium sp. NBC_01756]WSC89412.1 hypothetical protein OIE48_14865 [Streptosporangium sp. NBC_01756]
MSRIEFSYGAPEHGWAIVTIGHEDREVRMVVSYVTDALRDLLYSLVRVTQGDDFRFSWDGEPTEYRWIFTHEGDVVRLRILTFRDHMRPEPDEAGRESFTLLSETGPLVRAVVRSVRRLLSEMGEEDYARQWRDQAFPLRELNTLESWLRDH